MDITPVNLGTARIAERAYCKNLLIWRLRALAALLVVDVLILAFASSIGDGLARRYSSINAQVTKIQGQSLRYKNELAGLKEQQQVLQWNQDLAKRSLIWLNALGAISNRMPEDTWLTRAELGGAGGAVALDGTTIDMAGLAKLAFVLRSDGAFSDLRLVSSEALIFNGAPAVRFSMNLTVAGLQNQQAQETAEQTASAAPSEGGPKT